MNSSDFLLNAMRIWAWPIFAFSVLFLFRRPIGDLISRLHSVTSKMGNVTFTALKEIQQDLPSPKLITDPKVKDVHQRLNLSTRAVETIIPAPLSDCADDVSDEALPLMMESSWQRLMGMLKKELALETTNKRKTKDKPEQKDAPETFTSLVKSLKSSGRLAHVVKSVTRLADVRQGLQTGNNPIDEATIAAFVETVEKIIFTIQDQGQ